MRLSLTFGVALAFGLAPACPAADPLAVVPFFHISSETAEAPNPKAKVANIDWIGESIAETVHEALVSSGLLVLSREDREEVYRRLSLRADVVLTKASIIKIGQSLDAGRIVYGEFEAGDAGPAASLRISLRVIDLKNLRELPEIVESGPLPDLSRIETKLAWLLLRELNPSRAPSEETFFRDRPPVKVEALESYIRGLLLPNPEQKMKLFAQAAKIDPRFSQPNFQLGRMHFAKKEYRKAIPILSRVLRSDSHFEDALFLRGVSSFYDNDIGNAIDTFRQLSLNVPVNEVFNNLGAALSRRNDPAAADNFAKALEGDSTDPDYWFNQGYWLWKQGQFALATEKFRAVLDRVPNDAEATAMLTRCIRMDGPSPADSRSGGRERIKTSFEDSAWRQLRAELNESGSAAH